MNRIGKVLFVVGLIAVFLVSVSYTFALPQTSEDNPKETISVKNGIVVIDGHLSKTEKAEAYLAWETRMSEQVE